MSIGGLIGAGTAAYVAGRVGKSLYKQNKKMAKKRKKGKPKKKKRR